MKSKITLLLLSIISVIIISCNRETPEVVNTGVYGDLHSFITSKKPASQFFTLNAETGGVIKGAQGIVITFPANIFIHNDSSPVIGNVQVELIEIFNTSDIIFSGVFPVSDGTILNSGGEYFIEVSQSGEKLSVVPGSFMIAKMPAQALDPDMQLFAGIKSGDAINWLPFLAPPDSSGDSTFNSSFTFSSVDNTYVIEIDSTGWCNVDAYSTISNYTCTFNLTDVLGLNADNTTGYAVLDGENAVWPLGTSGYGTIGSNEITDYHLGPIPMHILVISVIDGNLYYGLLPVTPENGGDYTIIMIATTEEELDAIILDLP